MFVLPFISSVFVLLNVSVPVPPFLKPIHHPADSPVVDGSDMLPTPAVHT